MTTKDTDAKAYDLLEEIADELTDLIVRLPKGEVREALVELSQKVDDFLVDSEVGIVEDEPVVDDYDEEPVGVPVAGLTPEQSEQIEDDDEYDGYDDGYDDGFYGDEDDDDDDEGVL